MGSFSGDRTLMLAGNGFEDSGLCLSPLLLSEEFALSVSCMCPVDHPQCLQEVGRIGGSISQVTHSTPGRRLLTNMKLKPVVQASDRVCVHQW